MQNKIVIENLISNARKQLKILEQWSGWSKKEIEKDDATRGAIERYLYLAVQATINLAEAIIAYKKLRKPSTLSEAFYILAENSIISKELALKLEKMVGLRNVLAHDYVGVDYGVVVDVLNARHRDIEEFLDIARTL